MATIDIDDRSLMAPAITAGLGRAAESSAPVYLA